MGLGRAAPSGVRRPGSAAARVAAVALATLAYDGVLHAGVVAFGPPLFPYLANRSPDRLLYAAVLALTVLSSLILPKRLERPSDLALWIVQLTAGLPAVICAQLLTLLTPLEGFVFAVHVLGALAVARGLTLAGPRITLGIHLHRTARHLWIALVAYAIVIYALLIGGAGARPTFNGILDVYDLRNEFDARVATIPLMGYLLPLLHNVVNPVLVARGVFTRNWLLAAFGLGGQVLAFLLAGQKGVLLSTVFLLGLALLYRRGRVPSGAFLALLLAAAGSAALVIDRLSGTLFAGSVFTRRFLILPGALAVAYTSIFTRLTQTHFGDSLLRFLGNPYAQGPTPAHIVGLDFMGHAETNANVSFLGHGYLSWGYPGMYIEAAVVGATLWAIDRAADGLPPRVCALVMVMPGITLASASAFTAILTHGLAGLVLVLVLLPRDEWAPGSARALWLVSRGRRRRESTPAP